MKQTLIACILVAAAWGCGSNNSNTGSNANGNCAVGQTWNGTSCVATGYQNCQAGSYWNAAINQCSPNPVNAQQVYPNPNTGMIAPTPTPGMGLIPDCGMGQYWAGQNCAIALQNTPGLCASGQIGTIGYGCIQRSTICENQYAYLDGSTCVPAPVVKKRTCKVKHRHSTRVSSNDEVDADFCFSIDDDAKVKRRKDGSIRKIKNKNYKIKYDRDGNPTKIKFYN